MRQITTIQYLRALAALAVVAYHACDRARLGIGVGAAGVDVFFVVSGFVMWTVTAARPVTPATFAWHRLVRIVPLYWLATCALAAASLLAPAVVPHLNPSGWGVLLSLLFIPHRDPHGQIFPLLAAGWTLNYEMFFYALFTVNLLLPARGRLVRLLAALGALVAIGLVVPTRNPLLLTYTDPLLLEFACGLVLGWTWRSGRLPGVGVGVGMIGLGLIILTVIQILDLNVDAWRVAMWGGPAVLLVAGALSIEAGGRLPAWRGGATLGDASYSIYLLHSPLVAATMRIFAPIPALGVVLSLVISALGGIASFRLIERPLTNALRHLPNKLTQRVLHSRRLRTQELGDHVG